MAIISPITYKREIERDGRGSGGEGDGEEQGEMWAYSKEKREEGRRESLGVCVGSPPPHTQGRGRK